jgi:hypothetical protein
MCVTLGADLVLILLVWTLWKGERLVFRKRVALQRRSGYGYA